MEAQFEGPESSFSTSRSRDDDESNDSAMVEDWSSAKSSAIGKPLQSRRRLTSSRDFEECCKVNVLSANRFFK